MHCEIREQNDDVILHTDYQPSIILISPCNHFHMVSHLEELLQLVSGKFQWILTFTYQTQCITFVYCTETHLRCYQIYKHKKDGYRQQNVHQRQKLISIRGLSRSLKLMPFKSLGTVSYSPSIVTMAVSAAILEIFTVKEWHDLENMFRVLSRSL